MDRVQVQFSALPLDTDILSTNRNAMVGLGMALQAILGPGPNVDGLPCVPGTGLSVNIGPGSIYLSAQIDQTAYGSLPADTVDQIVQQGITFGQTPLSVPAPTTVGQSISYLIEAQFQQVDSNPVQLLYYNSVNPLQPLLGTATNTKRGGVCALKVKAGTAAATGTQTTPTPDAGWSGLYVVTVPYGATSITSGNIATATGAPFIGTKVAQLGLVARENIGQGLKDDGAGNLTLKLADGSMRVTAAGVQGNEPITTLSGSTSVTTANHFSNFVGAGTLNLSKTSTLWNGFCFSVSANSGLVTLNPNAADGFNGGAAGSAYTLQQGATALFITDAAGNWWIFNLSLPTTTQGTPYNFAFQAGFIL